ncbi:hypothetical protein CBW65_03885 [Tumebacillus avium]|uniref:Uncharacterized protein n=1 Tax=Tumebacillus avium TaxID=1903704 RepID=A0A1Y0IIL7_9BACL|nr:hypothetical protein [Tumebacillus avium]ARU60298.1 hypothetical protein CBW65_03885 [Tumebacillus avium]
MSLVRFLKLHDWAMPPKKEKVQGVESQMNARRWLVQERVKGACYPYRMGKEIGWTIYSPINIEIFPVEEVQIKGSSEDVHEVGRMLGIDFWMARDNMFLGIKPAGWFQVQQALVDGMWQGLFLPNGERTFEWRMGWGIEIPDDYVLLIQPLEGEENFVVHPGLLFAKSLAKFNQGLGFGIAFEPKRQHLIRKGDPLAKLLVFHKSALEIKEEIIERQESR